MASLLQKMETLLRAGFWKWAALLQFLLIAAIGWVLYRQYFPPDPDYTERRVALRRVVQLIPGTDGGEPTFQANGKKLAGYKAFRLWVEANNIEMIHAAAPTRALSATNQAFLGKEFYDAVTYILTVPETAPVNTVGRALMQVPDGMEHYRTEGFFHGFFIAALAVQEGEIAEENLRLWREGNTSWLTDLHLEKTRFLMGSRNDGFLIREPRFVDIKGKRLFVFDKGEVRFTDEPINPATCQIALEPFLEAIPQEMRPLYQTYILTDEKTTVGQVAPLLDKLRKAGYPLIVFSAYYPDKAPLGDLLQERLVAPKTQQPAEEEDQEEDSPKDNAPDQEPLP